MNQIKIYKYSGVCLLSAMLGVALVFQIFAVRKRITYCDGQRPPYRNCTPSFVAECTAYARSRQDSSEERCCHLSKCLCFLGAEGENLYYTLQFVCDSKPLEGDNSANTTLLFCFGFVVIASSTTCVFFARRRILGALGLTHREIKSVDVYSRGFRNKYAGDKAAFAAVVEKLLAYASNSERENKAIIRTVDFFGRKSLHFISLMILTYAHAIIFGNQLVPALSSFICFGATELFIAAAMWYSIDLPGSAKPYILPVLYGGYNRISDGPAALPNMITALIVGAVRTVVLGVLMVFAMKDAVLGFCADNGANFDQTRKLYLLTWVLANNGVTFGDTAGEGVGAFMGTRRFKVRGFKGQENERSVEGCVAVLTFTTISNVAGMVFLSDLLGARLAASLALLTLLSIGTTFLEMVSFKGTDNITISTFCMAAVLFWFKYVY